MASRFPALAPLSRWVAWLPVAALTPVAWAQDSGSRAVTIAPTLSVEQTFTTNRDLTAVSPHADAITQVSPGIRISSRAGRVQGSLDYSLSALEYARDPGSNTIQNALAANLKAEVLENVAFVDASANISQQAISAFGTQSASNAVINSNRSEVSTLSVAPSLHGHLGSFADVQAQVIWSASRSASTDLGDTRSVGSTLGIGGGQGLFRWGFNASHLVNDFTAGNNTVQDSAVANVGIVPDPDLKVTLRGGRQANNVLSSNLQWSNTWGWGVDWQPTDRTTFDYQSDEQYYGRSNNFTFQHRMVHSIWRYTDTRGVSGDPLSQASSRPLSMYDLFYAQFASIEPDPTRRDQLVRSFLQANGIDPNAIVGGGFLASGLTLQRSQTASVALTGVRTVVTLTGFRTQTQPLDAAATAAGDLSQVGEVRQLGLTLGVSHQLTPDASLAANTSRLKTLDAGSQPGTDQRSFSLSLAGTLGRRTTGIVSLRRTLFDSDSNPYNESAVVGSLSLRF